MIWRFLNDTRGAMLAEYALMLAVACWCIVFTAFSLGGSIKAAIIRATDLISGEVQLLQNSGDQPIPAPL
jgi:Flp pilus assembly pilin Flp